MIRLETFDNKTFSRGASRFKEVLWWLCRTLLFDSWFPVPSALKTNALRLFGAQIGKGVVIRGRVNITFPWRFKCGDNVWIGDEVHILSLAEVIVGSDVCLSQRAFVCTGSHNHQSESFDLVTKPIIISDGCWVGALTFLAPGVTLEAGSVTAAGSVVVKDVAAGVTVAGNPARPISTTKV
jgi:putative colanic acid biosynthesis acetyltransferase WcaF